MKKALSCHLAIISLSLCTFPASAQVVPLPAEPLPTDGSFRLSPQQQEWIRKTREINQRPITPQEIAGTWVKEPTPSLPAQLLPNASVTRERYAFATNNKYRREKITEVNVLCGGGRVENEVGTYSLEYNPTDHSNVIILNRLSKDITTTDPCDPQGPKTEKYDGIVTGRRLLRMGSYDADTHSYTRQGRLCLRGEGCFIRPR